MKNPSPHKALKKDCNELWAMIIKLRAGNKSELSGQTGLLNAHHILGKPNYRLRYDLENGISLTHYEHFRIAHSAAKQEMFRKEIKRLRGQDIYERLEFLRRSNSKTDLRAVEIYLKSELKKLKNET